MHECWENSTQTKNKGEKNVIKKPQNTWISKTYQKQRRKISSSYFLGSAFQSL